MERDPQTVVVGLDGSPEAQDALAWARRQAGTHDRIVVVRAWDVPLSTGYDIVVLADAEQAAKQSHVDSIEALGDDRLVPVLVERRSGPAIVGEAETADLVVVGHRGDSRISLMLGSTANYVAHHVNCPVVIVRGTSSEPVRRIVVGVDGDPQDGTSPSTRALQWAYRVPDVEEISVVHAWETPAIASGLYGGIPLGPEAFVEAAETIIDRAIEAAGPPPDDVALRRIVMRGSSSFSLVTASEDADLVVVGSRGHGGLAELVLGSTSTALAAHSKAPVAVIK